MFKVYEKFKCRDVWIRVNEIWQVYRVKGNDYTVIMFKNGEYIYVDESVDDILEAIRVIK